MSRGTYLTEEERGKILAFMEEKVGVREIARRLERSYKVVLNFLHDPVNYGKNKKGGPKKKLTPRIERVIVKAASNSLKSCNQIKSELNLNVSRWAVRRVLKNNPNIVRQKLKSAPKLLPRHKVARLEYARANMHRDWKNMMLLISFMMIALAMGEPGLLRVPKVYNAVITSNQNLSPSRAFPVIQPIIHRTAVGYVPPYYYTQVSPQFAGPDVVHLSQGPLKPGNEGDVRSEPSATVESSQIAGTKAETETDQGGEENKDIPRGGSKNKKEEEPLSFYPNYQSLYYDPYFYTYNGFNPHVVPGTYYVDYQPFGTVQPIPASTPKNGLSQHLLPGYHEEKKPVAAMKELKEKIPDVPPPPLPTAVPKSS